MVRTVSSALAPSVSFVAVGGSFTGVTVIEMVAGSLVISPSLAVNVKLSGPLASSLGV